MPRYSQTARRYRWVLAAILALVWGAGLVAALVEYATTYEAEATIWVHRAPRDLTLGIPDDPTPPIIQTVASEQVELLSQLLQTRAFVRDVVERTSVRSAIGAKPDDARWLDEIGKRFRVQVLGTNLLKVSFAAHDPRTGAELVNAALAVRMERVAQARVAEIAALDALYRRQFDIAHTQALEAQQRLDEFNAGNPGPLSAEDERQRVVLRLALDFAQGRVINLQSRIDQAELAPALREMAGLEFQVVDAPQDEAARGGGTRSAATLAAVAIAAGCAIGALLIGLGTLLPDHIGGPRDVSRLAPASLFASLPRVGPAEGLGRSDLRTSLAGIAFGNGDGAEGPTGRRTGDGREAWR